MEKLLRVLLVLACLCGIVVSTLAYGEHFNTGTAPCDINAVWDCGIVNHSSYAVMRGIPLALAGVVGYALVIAVAGEFPWLAFYGALAGFLFSLRLTYLEWRVLQVWCLYCVSSQLIITIVMLLALALGLRSRPQWAKRQK